MRNKSKFIQLAILLVLYIGVPLSALAKQDLNKVENLNPTTVAKIVQRHDRRPYKDFNHFVFAVYTKSKSLFSPEQHKALGDFLTNKAVDPQRRFVVHRMLGIYARLKYGGEARRLLQQLMVLPIYQGDGIDTKTANYEKFEKLIFKTAKQFNLKARKQVGGIELSLSGKRRSEGEVLSIKTRIDIAPLESNLWRLENSAQRIDPLQLSQIDDRWFGHGLHKKSAIVFSLFAMRVIKEEKLKVFNKLSLSIKTTDYSEKLKPGHYRLALEQSCVGTVKAAGAKTSARWVSVLGRVVQQYASSNSNGRIDIKGNCARINLSEHKAKLESTDIDAFLINLQFVSEVLLRLEQMKGLE